MLEALETRVDRFEAGLARLAEAQTRTEEALARLTERVDRLAAALDARLARVEDRVGEATGVVLEMRYQNRAPAYFDDILRRIHALSAEELATLLDDAEDQGVITAAERRDVLRVDVVARGRRRDNGEPAYLAAEVSAVIDEHDVWRALRRADGVARAAQITALPVVAGERITPDAEKLAGERGVWRVLDGRTEPPSPQLT